MLTGKLVCSFLGTKPLFYLPIDYAWSNVKLFDTNVRVGEDQAQQMCDYDQHSGARVFELDIKLTFGAI